MKNTFFNFFLLLVLFSSIGSINFQKQKKEEEKKETNTEKQHKKRCYLLIYGFMNISHRIENAIYFLFLWFIFFSHRKKKNSFQQSDLNKCAPLQEILHSFSSF